MEREQDILNELKELNSPLASFPRVMPHQVPPAYFEAFHIQALQAATTRALLTKDIPFSVPQGYFDALPQQILQSAKAADEAPEKRKNTGRNIWLNVRWAAAAILILFTGVGSYHVLGPDTITIQQQLHEIPDAAILAYVQDNIDDFETDFIISNIDDTNPVQTQAEGLNDETIEYYLENSGWQ